MRFTKALPLFVSLFLCTPICASPAGVSGESAQDWPGLHQKAVKAVQSGDFKTAAILFRECGQTAVSDGERAVSANDFGITLHQLNRDKEAREELEQAFRIWLNTPGEAVRLAQTTQALASVLRILGDYPTAEARLREAMKHPPADDENHALLLNELGDILREVGRPIEARLLFQQTLQLPGASSRRMIDAQIGLADLDRDSGSWQSAIERWTLAGQIASENNWPVLEAIAIRGLGVTYLEHHEPAKAEPLFRRALARFETAKAPEHEIAATLSCLGQLYIIGNKLAMAEEVLQKAIAITEKSLSPTHPQNAMLLEMLGGAVAYRNNMTQAHDYFMQARAIMAAHFGEQSPVAATVDASWGMVEQRMKRFSEAAADYEKALAVLDAAGPEAESLRSVVQRRYEEVCKTLHRKVAPVYTSFKNNASLR